MIEKLILYRIYTTKKKRKFRIMLYFGILSIILTLTFVGIIYYHFKENEIEKIVEKPITSVIPLNIFQTWNTKTLPTKMSECVESMKLCNPEFKYYLFDDDDCRDFLKNNFDAEILYSYDTLIPGAFKADLWRYCILYKFGGIYLDIKYKCINGFKFLTLTDDEYFVRDRYEASNKLAIYNALIICKAGNPKLLKCIKKVVENVRNRYYGPSELHITGPSMMVEFFTPNDKKKLKTLYHYDENGYYYIVYKNKKILMIYPEYRMEQSKFEKNKHYGVLWQQRKVYV